MNSRMIALIPAYKPDDKMLKLAEELKEAGFEIVIVDDGSGSDYEELFEKAGESAIVLSHSVNKGKGAALKTGLSYIYKYMAYSEAVKTDSGTKLKNGKDSIIVTVDADGQHKVADAMRIAEIASNKKDALVLGSRAFDGDVPARSIAGNTITRHVYSLATGVSIRDTQTGLRAFSRNMIPEMLEIDGDRYEYEINVLLRLAKEGRPIIEEDIDTIYIENNESSHFNALKDSFKIYKEILKFSASSLAAFAVDYVMFALLLAVGKASGIAQAVIAANIGARIISATFNYLVNRNYVFRSNAGVKSSAAKYFTLAALILAGNTAMLETLVSALGMGSLPAKLITEITFFTISWIVQKYIIFFKNEAETEMGDFGKSPFRGGISSEGRTE